jgi:Leucine-rich repeat (LRR) protein
MTKNLECLKLVECSSLTEVSSSLQYLDKLEELDVQFCYNLRSFPMLDSRVLRVLAISRCPDVTTCPTISQNMKWLKLEETSIKEVPQSVTSKLERLSLDGCSKMTKFPENLKDIVELNLRGTAIKEVPSSIQFLTRLRDLDMRSCSKLESFPEITVPMESLKHLVLSKTGNKEIPSSVKHMISLMTLKLDGTPINALPELPPSLETLSTRDCASLETTDIGRSWFGLDFTNCFKLDQKPLVAAMHKKI